MDVKATNVAHHIVILHAIQATSMDQMVATRTTKLLAAVTMLAATATALAIQAAGDGVILTTVVLTGMAHAGAGVTSTTVAVQVMVAVATVATAAANAATKKTTTTTTNCQHIFRKKLPPGSFFYALTSASCYVLVIYSLSLSDQPFA